MFTLHRVTRKTVRAGRTRTRRTTYVLVAEVGTLAEARRAARQCGEGRYVAGDERGRQVRFEVVERVVYSRPALRLAVAN